MSALLDRLEAVCIRREWRDRTPPRWMLWLSPSLRLRHTERFPLRMFLWELLYPALPIAIIQVLAVSAGILVIVWRDPWILHHHRLLLRLISLITTRYRFYVCVPLILIGFSFLLNFPNFYFWNRRAARLTMAGDSEQAVPDSETRVADGHVWPPPPTSP